MSSALDLCSSIHYFRNRFQSTSNLHRMKSHGLQELCSALWHMDDRLSQAHGAIFRHVLHRLVACYTRDILSGDQDGMRRHLHRALATVHHSQKECEHPSCLWICHECDYDTHNYGRDDKTCLLISKAPGTDAHTIVLPSDLQTAHLPSRNIVLSAIPHRAKRRSCFSYTAKSLFPSSWRKQSTQTDIEMGCVPPVVNERNNVAVQQDEKEHSC